MLTTIGFITGVIIGHVIWKHILEPKIDKNPKILGFTIVGLVILIVVLIGIAPKNTPNIDTPQEESIPINDRFWE